MKTRMLNVNKRLVFVITMLISEIILSPVLKAMYEISPYKYFVFIVFKCLCNAVFLLCSIRLIIVRSTQLINRLKMRANRAFPPFVTNPSRPWMMVSPDTQSLFQPSRSNFSARTSLFQLKGMCYNCSRFVFANKYSASSYGFTSYSTTCKTTQQAPKCATNM